MMDKEAQVQEKMTEETLGLVMDGLDGCNVLVCNLGRQGR